MHDFTNHGATRCVRTTVRTQKKILTLRNVIMAK